MKNFAFALLSLIMVFSSCQKDAPLPIDYAALQKKMDADPELIKARNFFHEHCRILALLSPQELKAIHDKTHSCGFYASDVSIVELEKCLTGFPNGENYVKGENFRREYIANIKKIEQKYPELMQMETRRKSEMLFPVSVSEARAKEVLQDYLSKKNNNNK